VLAKLVVKGTTSVSRLWLARQMAGLLADALPSRDRGIAPGRRVWPVMTAPGVRRRQRSGRTWSSQGQVEGRLEAECHALGVGPLQLLVA
jgi:hypothetical protein